MNNAGTDRLTVRQNESIKPQELGDMRVHIQQQNQGKEHITKTQHRKNKQKKNTRKINIPPLPKNQWSPLAKAAKIANPQIVHLDQEPVCRQY